MQGAGGAAKPVFFRRQFSGEPVFICFLDGVIEVDRDWRGLERDKEKMILNLVKLEMVITSFVMEDANSFAKIVDILARVHLNGGDIAGHDHDKKSSGFVKKSKRDQDSDSSNDEGNVYFGEALVVVGNDEMTEFVMDSGGSYHMTHKMDFLYDFKGFDGGSVQLVEDGKYVPGLRRSLISFGTLEKEGYIVKMQMGRIKVIKGCRVMMTGMRKNNCVYTLDEKVMAFDVQMHGGSKQVGLKQLGSKQVGFKQLGHKKVRFKQLGPGVETRVHRVQDEKRVWFEVELQGAQGDRRGS
ncbi:hypothetical protein Tco_0870134 [Tanacetum coccineum]